MCRRVILFGIFAVILNFVSICCERKVYKERNVANKSMSGPLLSYEYNPREAWQTFNQHAAIEEKRLKKKRQKTMKIKLRQMTLQRLPGLPGPKRSPGPPSDQLTKEELVRELREMLRVIYNLILIRTACTKEYVDVDKAKSSGKFLSSLFDTDRVVITPKVTWSFLWQLKDDVWINSDSNNEISNYYKPFGLGSHDRCQSFVISGDSYNCQNNNSLNDGKYRVSKSGFYTFYVSFHISKISFCEIYPLDSIEVLLCINSQCEESGSLRTITNMKNSTFTVSINGILQLKKNQYVSVYVHNNSRCSVKILRNSQIAGFLTECSDIETCIYCYNNVCGAVAELLAPMEKYYSEP